MKTTPVTREDICRSVVAVPPLARRADLSVNAEANAALLAHLRAGGVGTFLYGGNANVYNIPVSEFAATMATLAEAAKDDEWVIPSIGPDYGKLIDQAALLRATAFPTAMVLPLGFAATQTGTERGIRLAAERFGRPLIVYVKSEGWMGAEAIGRLVEDGVVCAIKYAIGRPDPHRDPFLAKLIDRVDPGLIVSGMGERPCISHMRHFGLGGFTSGSVCIAPARATQILRAAQSGDWATAAALRGVFMPLEDLRDRVNPFSVLHDAVTLAGIADMGPMLPMLSNLSADQRPTVAAAAKALLGHNGQAPESYRRSA